MCFRGLAVNFIEQKPICSITTFKQIITFIEFFMLQTGGVS